MAIAAAVLYALVRRASGPRMAAVSVAALALMPAACRYAQDARPYALTMLGATTTVWCWWMVVETGGRRWQFGLWLALVLTGLIHAFALLICVPLLLALQMLPADVRRGARNRTAAPMLGAGVVLAPFLLFIAGRAVGQPDPPAVTVLNVAEAWGRLPVAVLKPPRSVAAAAMVLVLGGLGVALMSRGGRASRSTFAHVPMTWLVLPPTLLIALQLVLGIPGLVTRYWLICLPALAIGVARALTWPRPGWRMPIIGLAALALLVAPTQAAIRGDDGHVGKRWAALAEVLQEPVLHDVPLLIRGFSQRGLGASAPDLAPERTPLNGEPGPSGRISPIPYGPGTAQFSALVAGPGPVLAYEQRAGGAGADPQASEFRQDALVTFSEPLLLCDWFGDALGLFARPDAPPAAGLVEGASRALEAVDPEQVACRPLSPR